MKRMLTLAVVMGPLMPFVAGCNSNSSQEVPLAKVADPPKLPPMDRSKIKPPPGSSPDVLPQQ